MPSRLGGAVPRDRNTLGILSLVLYYTYRYGQPLFYSLYFRSRREPIFSVRGDVVGHVLAYLSCTCTLDSETPRLLLSHNTVKLMSELEEGMSRERRERVIEYLSCLERLRERAIAKLYWAIHSVLC